MQYVKKKVFIYEDLLYFIPVPFFLAHTVPVAKNQTVYSEEKKTVIIQ